MIGDKEMDLFNDADKYGQSRILPTIKALFSGCTLQIEQHYEDKGGIDMYLTATTKSGKEVLYSIECKDRKMSHTKYQYDGYIIEDKKIKSLLKAHKMGYRPIYLNSFNDNYIICWDLSKLDFGECGETGEIEFFKTEVTRGQTGKEKKNKTTLKNSQAVCITKMVDEKQNS